jgi:hypothetical protein
MATKYTAVFGIYSSVSHAEQAVDLLVTTGFASRNVSVLLPDHHATRDVGYEKETKAPEGATVGASTGGLVGGALGVLAGIGAIAIPEVGPFVAAGPIMAGLAGLGAGGAVGGLIGGLAGVGIPEYEARLYQGRIQSGGVLLSVHCDNTQEVDRAKAALRRTGAEDIASAGEGSFKLESRETVGSGSSR